MTWKITPKGVVFFELKKRSKFDEQVGMTNEQMKEYCAKVFPTLKRWEKA